MKKCKCGKTISGSKDYCARCAANEVLGSQPLGDGVTHILVDLASKKQEDLYRADGMLVASRQGDQIHFTEDIATAQHRLFLSDKLASLFLRRVADIDLWAHANCQPVVGNKVTGFNDAIFRYAEIPEGVAVIQEMDGDIKGFDDSPVRLHLPHGMTIKTQ